MEILKLACRRVAAITLRLSIALVAASSVGALIVENPFTGVRHRQTQVTEADVSD
jgi:hypothetical protein